MKSLLSLVFFSHFCQFSWLCSYKLIKNIQAQVINSNGIDSVPQPEGRIGQERGCFGVEHQRGPWSAGGHEIQSGTEGNRENVRNSLFESRIALVLLQAGGRSWRHQADQGRQRAFARDADPAPDCIDDRQGDHGTGWCNWRRHHFHCAVHRGITQTSWGICSWCE